MKCLKAIYRVKVDWLLLIFFILLMILPFILFGNNATVRNNAPTFVMVDDTIPELIVTFEIDTLSEDFPAIYSPITIALSTIPIDTVLILVYPDAQLNAGAGAGMVDTLVFSPYPIALVPKEVKVKPIDDALFESIHVGVVSFVIITNDTIYDDFSIADITYTILDNELPPGISQFIPVDTFLTEGLTGVDLLFALTSIPNDTVIITIDPDDQMRITGIPGEAVTLIFEPNASALSYNGAGIRAVDDVIYEGMHNGVIQFTIFSDDPAYADFVIGDVIYAIVDNDNEPGINYTEPDTLEVIENLGEVSVSIALNSVPTDTVIITIIPDAQLRIIAGPAAPYDLVFAPNASALNNHIAIIKAYDDALFEGPHTGNVSFEITTSDADYAGFIINDFTIAITDNDLPPGIVIFDTTAMAGIEGDSLYFNVNLMSIPEFTVTINFDPDINLDLGKGKDADISLKFKEDSALIAKEVKVIMFDDPIFEGLHIGTIVCSITTSDTIYDNYVIPDIIVTITDNDVVSIVDFNLEQFNVFPTVSNGLFTCNISDSLLGGTFAVFDVAGKMVINGSLPQTSLNLTALASGSYIILASKNDARYYQKVIISK